MRLTEALAWFNDRNMTHKRFFHFEPTKKDVNDRKNYQKAVKKHKIQQKKNRDIFV